MRAKPDKNQSAAKLRGKAEKGLKAKRQGEDCSTAVTVRRHLEPTLQKDQEAFEHRLRERTSELQRTTTEPVKDIDFEKAGSGRSIGFAVITRDITERRRTEDLVRVSEAKYRTLVEMTGTGYLIIDVQGRVLDANQEYVRLSGHGALREILGRSVIEWTAGAAKQRNAAAVAQCAKDGFIRNFVTEYMDAKGQATFVEINATVDGEGESLQIVSLCRDITERKRAEEALLASEEVSRATFEQAAVGMAHVGTDGRWLRVNDKLCAIVGYPRDELMKMTFQDITHPEDLEADLNYVRQVLSGEIKNYSMEKRFVRKDGSSIWINLTVSLVRSDAGAARHFISVVEDIAERKNAEEELMQLRLHLWHADRVAQTAAVTASLAHELNQPLAAILTNAEVGLQVLAGGNPDLEEIREILTDIVEDDKRAGAVISGLRDMLRRKETRREKINLAVTIRRIIEMLHSELLDKQVQFHLELEPDSLVLADKAQVQQVILNLVTNAVEAMQGQPAWQRRLELTMAHTDAGEALVAVHDSGPGILDDWHKKMFEAFWTTKQEGLGIGLIISRSIIESHKGRLWFANNPDQGVTFYFTLPIIDDLDPGAQ
jgi:PAS domain S-box-containing protein